MLQLGYSELSDASIEASYTFELDGEGADVRLRMAALSKDKEKKHYKVHIKHNAPHTTGIMDNYGVAKDEAHLVIDELLIQLQMDRMVQHHIRQIRSLSLIKMLCKCKSILIY